MNFQFQNSDFSNSTLPLSAVLRTVFVAFILGNWGTLCVVWYMHEHIMPPHETAALPYLSEGLTVLAYALLIAGHFTARSLCPSSARIDLPHTGRPFSTVGSENGEQTAVDLSNMLFRLLLPMVLLEGASMISIVSFLLIGEMVQSISITCIASALMWHHGSRAIQHRENVERMEGTDR